MLLFFIADNRSRYFATLKPQLKDNTSVRRRSVQLRILCKPGSLRYGSQKPRPCSQAAIILAQTLRANTTFMSKHCRYTVCWRNYADILATSQNSSVDFWS